MPAKEPSPRSSGPGSNGDLLFEQELNDAARGMQLRLILRAMYGIGVAIEGWVISPHPYSHQ